MEKVDEAVLEQYIRAETKSKYTWTIESSTDFDFIVEVAKLHGWLDTPPKVQVRRVSAIDEWYVIEPYEQDCSCPNIIQPPTGG